MSMCLCLIGWGNGFFSSEKDPISFGIPSRNSEEVNFSDKYRAYADVYLIKSLLPSYMYRYLEDPLFQKQIEETLFKLKMRQLSHMKESLAKAFPIGVFKKLSKLHFDYDFKYSKFKKTKDEIPLELNYEAMKENIEEGFEAVETLRGYLPFFSNFEMLGHVGLVESWNVAKIEDLENVIKQTSVDDIDAYKRSFSGTVIYGLGMKWGRDFSKGKSIEIEGFFQQNAKNEWLIRRYLFPERNFSGIVFDLIELSIKICF